MRRSRSLVVLVGVTAMTACGAQERAPEPVTMGQVVDALKGQTYSGVAPPEVVCFPKAERRWLCRIEYDEPVGPEQTTTYTVPVIVNEAGTKYDWGGRSWLVRPAVVAHVAPNRYARIPAPIGCRAVRCGRGEQAPRIQEASCRR